MPWLHTHAPVGTRMYARTHRELCIRTCVCARVRVQNHNMCASTHSKQECDITVHAQALLGDIFVCVLTNVVFITSCSRHSWYNTRKKCISWILSVVCVCAASTGTTSHKVSFVLIEASVSSSIVYPLINSFFTLFPGILILLFSFQWPELKGCYLELLYPHGVQLWFSSLSFPHNYSLSTLPFQTSFLLNARQSSFVNSSHSLWEPGPPSKLYVGWFQMGGRWRMVLDVD